MTERDFDNLFNDKFNQYEGADFSSSQWPDMQSQLDKRDRFKKILGWFWPFLLLLLLVSNGISWYQYSQLARQISKNDVQEQLNTSHTNTIFINDTVVKRSIIYQFDTIYKKTFVYEQANIIKPNPIFQTVPNSISEKNVQSNTPVITNSKLTQGLANNDGKIENTHSNTATEKGVKTDSTIQITTPSVQDSIKEIKNAQLATISDKTTQQKVDTTTSQVKDEIKPEKEETAKTSDKATPIIKRKIQAPTTFLGLVTAPTFYIPAQNISSKGWQMGIRGNIQASERWHFFAETNIAFSSTKSEDKSTVPAHITMPEPSPSYVFDSWEISDFKTLNYIAGVQYHFKNSKKLKPYLTLGIHGTTYLPYEIEFEYVNTQNKSEQYLSRKSNLTNTQINYLYTSGGVKWASFNNWQIGTELFSDLPIQKNTFDSQQWGVKILALYRLNNH